MIGGEWQYCCCFVGCCLQDLFNISRSIQAVKLFLQCPRGVMAKAMDNRIVMSEFKRQSRNYIHFQSSTVGKGMNSRIYE